MKTIDIVGAILIIFLMNQGKGCVTSEACKRQNDFDQKVFKGIVFKKYLNTENHGYPMVKIKGVDDLNLVIDTSGFFRFVKAGDSVVKGKDSPYLNVIRQKSTHRFKINFFCEEN